MPFDPLEETVRQAIRGFIGEMLEGELDGTLGRAATSARAK